ncbi:MAG: hypothetical protein GX970_08355 [Phyllobacteriaceae bacterium]|nr:hypothetical protein [Phyllobacteriaceae bacterium]
MEEVALPVEIDWELVRRDYEAGQMTINALGRAHVMLDPDELAADDGPVLSRRRGDVAERPGRLGLVHYERERDYQTATATALRPGAGPLVTETLPLVLDGAGARRGAERLLDQRAGAGDRLEFALRPNEIGFEPGDRVALPDLAEGPFEIVEIRDGAMRRVVAEAVGRGDAVATGVDRPRGGAGVPQAEVAPVMVVAHLPPVPEDVSRSRLVVGAYANPWPGSVRIVDAATGAALGEVSRPAHIGRLVSPFVVGPEAVWDRGAFEIVLSSGHLADGEELAVLGGGNRVAVETDTGWEVIGFAEAELISAKTYRLTRLLRGLEGTVPGAAASGARVMVLGSGTSVMSLEAHHLGESRALKVYAGSADTSGQDLLIETGLEPALPLAPVHLRARLMDDGDIRLSWLRRSRADGDGWGVVEPALEHVPEAWRVSILDGGDVVRTFDTSGPEVTYSSAEQAADFGGPAPDFAFTIAQVSAVLGAGHMGQGVYHG